MRNFLLVTASLAGLGLAMPAAQAADMVPPPEPVATWTGFHVGVGGGAGYNSYDAESLFQKDFFDIDGDPFDLSIEGKDLGKWYGMGTIDAGIDVQIPDSPIVVGIFGSYDFNGDNDAHAESLTLGDDEDYSFSYIKAELDDSWFLGGRVGFAFHEDTLFYALVGYTWVDGKVEAFHSFSDSGCSCDDDAYFKDKQDVSGWTVGGGIEHMFADFLSLKIEYRHDFLDDIKWDQEAFDSGPKHGFGDDWEGVDEDNRHSGEVDFGRDTIRAVLSLRFNPGWFQ